MFLQTFLVSCLLVVVDVSHALHGVGWCLFPRAEAEHGAHFVVVVGVTVQGQVRGGVIIATGVVARCRWPKRPEKFPENLGRQLHTVVSLQRDGDEFRALFE